MKKLLLITVLLFFGIITNAQSLGMSAIEVRQEIEGKGYEVETLTLNDGTRVLYYIEDNSLKMFYLNSKNYVNGILFTLNNMSEQDCREIITKAGYIRTSVNEYEKNDVKLYLKYSTEFDTWTTFIMYK